MALRSCSNTGVDGGDGEGKLELDISEEKVVGLLDKMTKYGKKVAEVARHAREMKEKEEKRVKVLEKENDKLKKQLDLSNDLVCKAVVALNLTEDDKQLEELKVDKQLVNKIVKALEDCMAKVKELQEFKDTIMSACGSGERLPITAGPSSPSTAAGVGENKKRKRTTSETGNAGEAPSPPKRRASTLPKPVYVCADESSEYDDDDFVLVQAPKSCMGKRSAGTAGSGAGVEQLPSRKVSFAAAAFEENALSTTTGAEETGEELQGKRKRQPPKRFQKEFDYCHHAVVKTSQKVGKEGAKVTPTGVKAKANQKSAKEVTSSLAGIAKALNLVPSGELSSSNNSSALARIQRPTTPCPAAGTSCAAKLDGSGDTRPNNALSDPGPR